MAKKKRKRKSKVKIQAKKRPLRKTLAALVLGAGIAVAGITYLATNQEKDFSPVPMVKSTQYEKKPIKRLVKLRKLLDHKNDPSAFYLIPQIHARNLTGVHGVHSEISIKCQVEIFRWLEQRYKSGKLQLVVSEGPMERWGELGAFYGKETAIIQQIVPHYSDADLISHFKTYSADAAILMVAYSPGLKVYGWEEGTIREHIKKSLEISSYTKRAQKIDHDYATLREQIKKRTITREEAKNRLREIKEVEKKLENDILEVKNDRFIRERSLQSYNKSRDISTRIFGDGQATNTAITFGNWHLDDYLDIVADESKVARHPAIYLVEINKCLKRQH